MTNKAEVRLGAIEEKRSIFYDPINKSLEPFAEEGQDGYPFAGTEATWWVIRREPEKVEPQEEEKKSKKSKKKNKKRSKK